MTVSQLVTRPGKTTLRIELLERREVPSYSITDLGTLGGTMTFPMDINDRGQVVGWSATGTVNHAFLWDPISGMHDLGSLAGGTSQALAINELGQVVGWSALSGAPQGAAFIWERGAGMTALPPLNGVASSRAEGINNLGQVGGFSKGVAFSDYKATLWEGGVAVDLGTVGTEASRAYDLNDHGQVVGKVTNYADGPSMLWDNGSIVKIGALGPYGAFAVDINNHGQVTGSSPIVGPGNFFLVNRPFLYEVGGSIQNLETLECRNNTVAFGIGEGINDKGEVVGWHGCVVTFTDQSRFAAVWNETEGWKDLNKLIPPNSDWELTQTKAINNHGQIVGIGYKSSSTIPRAYLLTPQPAPVPPVRLPDSPIFTSWAPLPIGDNPRSVSRLGVRPAAVHVTDASETAVSPRPKHTVRPIVHIAPADMTGAAFDWFSTALD